MHASVGFWGSRATPHKSAGINISTAGRSNSAYPVLPGLVTRAHSPYGGSPKGLPGDPVKPERRVLITRVAKVTGISLANLCTTHCTAYRAHSHDTQP